MPTYRRAIVWLRRDLRLDDNVALANALDQSADVTPAFILDPKLLRGERVGAAIVQFFFESVAELRARLRGLASELLILEGDAIEALPRAVRSVRADAVFFNDDYEPGARVRDDAVERSLRDDGVHVARSTDHVYFGADEVTQRDGKPYTVFTPYKRRWLASHVEQPRPPLRAKLARLTRRDQLPESLPVPVPADYGHASSSKFPRGGERRAKQLLQTFVRGRIDDYDRDRNLPAIEGTSLLSPHLRAGTIGIRTCVAAAAGLDGAGPRTWLDELVWRDFYQQIVFHFPRLEREPFVSGAERIRWIDDGRDWDAWTRGATGYPIVDAAMRQLNETGWMHNRLRMIVASFLSKHLLIDYRRGERYFEQHLADADPAANNGGWQWSSSVGTDPMPYFRIFNPTLQGKTFDPNGAFVRRYVPELARIPDAYVHAPWTMPPLAAAEARCTIGRDYPPPIVDHAEARGRALAVYTLALRR